MRPPSISYPVLIADIGGTNTVNMTVQLATTGLGGISEVDFVA